MLASKCIFNLLPASSSQPPAPGLQLPAPSLQHGTSSSFENPLPSWNHSAQGRRRGNYKPKPMLASKCIFNLLPASSSQPPAPSLQLPAPSLQHGTSSSFENPLGITRRRGGAGATLSQSPSWQPNAHKPDMCRLGRTDIYSLGRTEMSCRFWVGDSGFVDIHIWQ